MALKSLIGRSEVLQRALTACKSHLVFAAVFSALLNFLYLTPTLYMMEVYDRVMPTRGAMTLVLVSAVLLFALGTLAGLDWMRSRLLIRIGARLDHEFAGDVLTKVLSEPGLSRPQRAQAVRDMDTFRQALAGTVLLALMDAPWAPIFLIAAFLLHPALGVITMIAAALLVLLAWLNERATAEPMHEAAQAANAAYAAQDYASATAEVVRGLGMTGPLVARQLLMRAGIIQLQTQASFAGSRYVTLTKFFRLALQSGALGVGAYLAINNQISGGAVMAASFLMTRALSPVEQIVGGWRSISQARESLERLDILLRDDKSRAERTALPRPRGELGFERVFARALEGERLAVADVTFRIAPGEIVTVVGPSGAGKSTLMRLAAGVGVADRGAVRIDGASLGDWAPDALARHIGYLPQDFVLFPGTVKDNISRFAAHGGELPQSVDEKAVKAAKSVGAHEMILRLPLGYDTPLGANGAGLSAGQRQRVALARAFYGDPSLLVLDEPNAHLDGEGEMALIAALEKAKMFGVSALLVVHHGPALRVADRAIVLRDGQVQAIGPMDQVVRMGSPEAAPTSPEPRTAPVPFEPRRIA